MLHCGSIRGISSDTKLTHLLCCCATKMQTYCRLTDCTGSRPETCFRFAGFYSLASLI